MNDLGMLRPAGDDDVMAMLEWRNHPETRAGMYSRHIIGTDEHLAWWERTARREDQRYFIYEQKGVAAGVMGITGIDRANRRAEWGFYTAPGAAAGTGRRMNFLALRHAFDTLNLHKLCGEVLAFNTKSIRLHERLGFTREGVLRQHHAVEDRFEDVHVFGLLAAEWRTRAPALEAELLNHLKPEPDRR